MLVTLLLARADAREPAHAGSSSGEKTAPPKGAAEVLSWSGIWREQEVEGELHPARQPRAAPAPGNGGRQGAAEQGGRGGEPGGGHPGELVRLSRAKCASWLRARFPQEILEVLPDSQPHDWKQTVLRQSPVGGDCFGGCEGRKAAQRR